MQALPWATSNVIDDNIVSQAVKRRRPRRKPAHRFHHGDLREALLTAGEIAMEREGHASITLGRLAAAAGVTQPAVYRHFASKEELLAALGARGYASMGRSVIGAALNAARGADGQPDPVAA